MLDDEEKQSAKKYLESSTEKRKADSDYYSSDTDYSYSYQYDKDQAAVLPKEEQAPYFKDVEKQEVPDYASMDSFREDHTEVKEGAEEAETRPAETQISGTTFDQTRPERYVLTSFIFL